MKMQRYTTRFFAAPIGLLLCLYGASLQAQERGWEGGGQVPGDITQESVINKNLTEGRIVLYLKANCSLISVVAPTFPEIPRKFVARVSKILAKPAEQLKELPPNVRSACEANVVSVLPKLKPVPNGPNSLNACNPALNPDLIREGESCRLTGHQPDPDFVVVLAADMTPRLILTGSLATKSSMPKTVDAEYLAVPGVGGAPCSPATPAPCPQPPNTSAFRVIMGKSVCFCIAP
jgi:hypothetical protein